MHEPSPNEVIVQLIDKKLILIEIKPVAFMNKRENLERVAALESFCASAGFGFLLTDGEFSRRELLGRQIHLKFRDELLLNLRCGASLRYTQAKALVKESGASWKDLLAAVIQFDMDLQYDPWQLSMKRWQKDDNVQRTWRGNREY